MTRGRTTALLTTAAVFLLALLLPDPTVRLVRRDAESSSSSRRREAVRYYSRSVRNDRVTALEPFLQDEDEALRARAASAISSAFSPESLSLVRDGVLRGEIERSAFVDEVKDLQHPHLLAWLRETNEMSGNLRTSLYETQVNLERNVDKWRLEGKMDAVLDVHFSILGDGKRP